MRIIGGAYKRRILKPPGGLPVRPTTDLAKEALFNIMQNYINWDGKSGLDLFSGTGSIAFELSSRGCASVTAVDMNQHCISWLKKGSGELHLENLKVKRSDVFRFVRQTPEKYDFIFADPPYQMSNFIDLVQLIFENELLKSSGLLVIEHPESVDLSDFKEFFQHRKYGKVNFSFFQLEP